MSKAPELLARSLRWLLFGAAVCSGGAAAGRGARGSPAREAAQASKLADTRDRLGWGAGKDAVTSGDVARPVKP